MTALEQRNNDLRGLLSRALRGAGAGSDDRSGDGAGEGADLNPALRAAALAHMTARAASSPMRYVSTASTPAKGGPGASRSSGLRTRPHRASEIKFRPWPWPAGPRSCQWPCRRA
jgi:hypothetical protein